MPIMYFVRQIYPHDIPPPFGNSVFRVGLGSLLEFQVEGQLAKGAIAVFRRGLLQDFDANETLKKGNPTDVISVLRVIHIST